MNKLILIILSLFCFNLSFGQHYNKQQKLERIKAQKIAFISSHLSLTPEEAQIFWPVYNEFFSKKEALTQEKRVVTRDLQSNWETLSKEKKTQLVDDMVSFRLKEAELAQEYHNKFKDVLPIEKVIKLYNAENQFKTYLLRQIKGQNKKNINPNRREQQRK
ncbi:hypothetical protein E9993_11245 [Labilibacter sediminis]|nr:hypothetical protein E9993_11245 [Labilibacter sediminis]